MMGRIRNVVGKLRGRSPHELFSRVAQHAFAFGERASLQVSGAHRAGAPVFNAETVFGQPFFPGVGGADVRATVAALRAAVPLDETDVLQRATAAERGDIQLYGHGVLHLGSTPDWQLDPFAGLRAPQTHWSTIPYLDREIVGDHKVVWEINRHQYFVTFGQAYAYSRDERWPRAFVRMLDSWLESNPPTIGMNWCSSLEVSYRAISWLWAMQLMREAPIVDVAFKSRVLASLQSHGRHLERYLSTYFSPNTHLTGEALGLFYIGTQCPELPRAKHWADLGASILERALEQQVLPDGVYFEQATQYHRYTIDIYLHYWLLARQLGRKTAPRVAVALNQMFDVLLHITRADGTYPLVGDDDGGRLMQLDAHAPHDVRSLHAMGAVLLQRNDLAWAGRGDDAALCWMLGPSSISARDSLVSEPPAELSRAFTMGGMFAMREGWGSTDGLAVIDAGPHGALSFGHSHADPLAIDLTVGGHPFFVDSGTYTYVGDERNAFRSTAAHNTVEIDGVSSSIPDTAFRWSKVSHAAATEWMTTPEFAFFSGTHDGYQTLADPVNHQRAVLHNHAGIWVVRDTLAAKTGHEAALRWHCAPGLEARVTSEAPARCELSVDAGPTPRGALIVAGSPAGRMHLEKGWVSSQFGQKEPATVCTWREPFHGNAVLASVVIDTARLAVATEAEPGLRDQVKGATAVVVLEVTESGPPRQVLVVVGNGRAITFNALQLEADIALIYIDKTSGRPLGLTGVGVSRAVNNGVTFVPADGARHWVVVANDAAGAGGSWVVRSGSIPILSPS